MERRYLPVDSLRQEQAEAILNAFLQRVKGMPPDTLAGYYSAENGVPVVWNNPQAAALDWQQLVNDHRDYGYGTRIPVLQAWPDGESSIDRRFVREDFPGYYYYRGHSNLPQPPMHGPLEPPPF